MDKQKADLSRRNLLKTLTIGTAATAVISSTIGNVAQATESKHAKSNKDGYHETAHIRAYYNSLRS